MQVSTSGHSVMSQSHKVTNFKSRTIDEAFQEQCFLWERGASVGAIDLLHRPIFNCQDIVHAPQSI